MARWKLKAKHYLNVPGTEVTFEETNRDTGKKGKKNYPVPLFLDPEDQADQNYPQEGMIVVAQGQHNPRDIVFEGPPTPDMEPLDDEAQAITDKYKDQWVHPIDSLEGTFSDQIIRSLEAQMNKVALANQSLNGVSQESFTMLQQQVQQLMAQNTELTKALTTKDRRI